MNTAFGNPDFSLSTRHSKHVFEGPNLNDPCVVVWFGFGFELLDLVG